MEPHVLGRCSFLPNTVNVCGPSSDETNKYVEYINRKYVGSTSMVTNSLWAFILLKMIHLAIYISEWMPPLFHIEKTLNK